MTILLRPYVKKTGFTLLEMMVVLAVMGLVLALVVGFGQPRSHRLEAQAAARQVAAALRDARGQAIAEGIPVAFRLPQLPPWLTVFIQAPPGGIIFAPDGSASGGEVLLDGAGRRTAITTDWLTGRVAINGS